MKPEILKAKNISKVYSHPKKIAILQEISLTVSEGESLAITGPSGVGKSTLLHILGTLEAPSSGSLELMGRPVLPGDHAELRNAHIGFVFQNFNLLEEIPVIENLLMPARIGKIGVGKGSPALQHAEELLERVGLSTHRDHLAKNLSGGEKQRVAIARAFSNHPDLILADEPSGNLDESNSERIHELLIGAAKDLGKALIVVTHNMSLANMCDKHYRLTDGGLTSK